MNLFIHNIKQNQTYKGIYCVSYNMHGFNQGSHTVRDLKLLSKPDVFLLQDTGLLQLVYQNLNVNFLSIFVLVLQQCLHALTVVSYGVDHLEA